jgi:hypothetical protein
MPLAEIKRLAAHGLHTTTHNLQDLRKVFPNSGTSAAIGFLDCEVLPIFDPVPGFPVLAPEFRLSTGNRSESG